MTTKEFKQREYDCFLSYASEDAELAKRIAKYITAAGLKVFFDQRNFAAASEVVEGLATAMENSKACLMLLSSKSIHKKYVREEIKYAKTQSIEYEDEFRLIAAVLEEGFNPSDHFKSLTIHSWLSLHNGELDLENSRNLLLSLRQMESLAKSGQPQIYVSCSWRDHETHPRDEILKQAKGKGAFLVGDSRDQTSYEEEGIDRIRRIMSSCTGFLAIYPDRKETGKTAEQQYKYFPDEVRIAQELGLVQLNYCANREALPSILRSDLLHEWKSDGEEPDLNSQMEAFLDDAGTKQPHVFMATDFKKTRNRNEAAKDIVESLLGMECKLGKKILGKDLRTQIRNRILEANLVIADLACSFIEDTSALQINVNTCVEAGMAFAADRPLFVTALDPSTREADISKTKEIPFYFRDYHIEWYKDDPGFLANIYRIAYNRRRRVINDEID